jgi:hypothetical protein
VRLLLAFRDQLGQCGKQHVTAIVLVPTGDFYRSHTWPASDQSLVCCLLFSTTLALMIATALSSYLHTIFIQHSPIIYHETAPAVVCARRRLDDDMVDSSPG